MATSLASPVKESVAKTEQVSVVLVVPPFASAACPALGPSLLTAGCRANEISATVYYANLELAAMIGYKFYQKITQSSGEDMLGEAIFQASAFGKGKASDSHAIKEIFKSEPYIKTYGVEEENISEEDIDICVAHLDTFLANCVEDILAMDPKIVGFSSVFQQTLASIALAKRIKEKRPDILTILGGANASSPMGDAVIDATKAFDYVFSGESDFEFPQFCENYLKDEKLPEKNVVQCSSINQMDQTEIPKYDDFFAQLKVYQEKKTLPKELPLWLHFETSRGCWWGAKSHCTFCGLNALDMSYRRKSKDRIMKDFEDLSQYGIKHLRAVDNIMPYEFHRDVLPALAEKEEKFELFYEVKSNLKVRDLDLFVAAGVTAVQPGIESLSSNVLKLIAKGVTGPQNLCLLRNGISRKINIYWNILAGVPGEKKIDYEEMLRLFPLVEHLQPPEGWGHVRLDRFSPYHSFPDKYGIKNIKPFRGYYRLYPENTRFDDVAYYFVGDYKTEFLEDGDLQERFEKGIKQWNSRWMKAATRSVLTAYPLGEETLLIEDTRPCSKGHYFVANAEMTKLLKELESPLPCDKLAPEKEKTIKSLLERHLVIAYEDHYLSIVAKASSLPNSTKFLAAIFFLFLIGLLAFLFYFFGGK